MVVAVHCTQGSYRESSVLAKVAEPPGVWHVTPCPGRYPALPAVSFLARPCAETDAHQYSP